MSWGQVGVQSQGVTDCIPVTLLDDTEFVQLCSDNFPPADDLSNNIVFDDQEGS